MNLKPAIVAVLAACTIAACKKKKEELPIPYDTLTGTTSYFNTFKGSDSVTTVSFTDETVRSNMLKDMEDYMQTYGLIPVDGERLRRMYTNTGSPFFDTSLNKHPSLSLSSVTAGSLAGADAVRERNRFNGWIDSVTRASQYGLEAATPGKPGTVGGTYLVNGDGIEYLQLFKDGLIGAIMLDQLCNVQLGAVPGADNTNAVAGANYTAMEHAWDAAYGNLTANPWFPFKNSAGSFQEVYLGYYVRQAKGEFGDPTALYLAFLKGRAAIVNKDNGTRDEQIAYLRKTIEKAVATVAISYLNKATIASSNSSYCHTLSEALGFIYALRYAHGAKIGAAKSDELMATLFNAPEGSWTLTKEKIYTVRDYLALTYVVDRDAIVNP
jgi:hypothetical protein